MTSSVASGRKWTLDKESLSPSLSLSFGGECVGMCKAHIPHFGFDLQAKELLSSELREIVLIPLPAFELRLSDRHAEDAALHHQ